MLRKSTFIDQVTMTRDGVVEIRFIKAILDENVLVSQQYHRTSVSPGMDPEAVLAAVDKHLSGMGESSVIDEPQSSVLAKADLVGFIRGAHTPSVIARFNNKRAQGQG